MNKWLQVNDGNAKNIAQGKSRIKHFDLCIEWKKELTCTME